MAPQAAQTTLSATSRKNEKGVAMRKLFEYGGIAASIVLIAFGIGSIAIGAWGIDTVRDNLKQEQIYFGDASQDDAVPASLSGKQVTTGERAREFAKVMRKHALESTGGLTYSQMGRFLDENGKPTSDEAEAAKDPKTGQPVANEARNIWVTETALATALNVAYFGERVGVFGIVMGIALLLTGIGFLILTLGGALRARDAREAEPAAEPARAMN
jgi:sorbitol-specific phosphotransferase system component IIC